MPFLIVPHITLASTITPRYGSNQESKISACSGFSGVPLGGGRRFTMASRTSGTPCPVFALTSNACEASRPTAFSIISLARGTSALGRSILLMTGMMSRLLWMARYAFASVCASTPCDASTTSSAPSHDASERETS